MHITIFSGGSGSETIQKGLWDLFGDFISVSIIINGYDDGKSTGIVRKICNQTILGPSDLRKNQLIRHKFRYGETEIYRFLNHRFTSDRPKYYLEKMIETLDISYHQMMYETLEHWFSFPLSLSYPYEDFNVGNIVYASFFKRFGVSETIIKMNDLLRIPDEVRYQSNEALMLKATTRSGKILDSEESIVNYSCEDRIERVYLLNSLSEEIEPELEDEVVSIMKKTDLLLFSCGTQWSSIIPTYLSKHFYEIVSCISSPKYMVMNIDNDKDMIGYQTQDYLELFRRYIPLSQITLLFSNESSLKPPTMYTNPYCVFHNCVKNKKHDGIPFWIQTFMHYFRDRTKTTGYIFDYDYTLYDKDQLELSERIRQEVIKLPYKSILLSANHYENIKSFENIPILSNNGSLFYSTKQPIKEGVLLNDSDKKEITNILSEFASDSIRIQDRLVSISIKPFTDHAQIDVLRSKIDSTKFKIVHRGKTTIEIMYLVSTKRNGYDFVLQSLPNETFLYLSDQDDIEMISSDHKWIIPSLSMVLVFLTMLNQRKQYMPNLIVVSGGRNTRMNQSSPKLLMEINHKSIATHMYEKTKPYVNDMYVITNEFHAPYFVDSFYTILTCDHTRGNLETLHKGLTNIGYMKNHRNIIIWGDCFLSDSKLIAELTSCYHHFTIPCNYETDPYAYVVTSDGNTIDSFGFKKNKSIDKGYHDLSIFYIETTLIVEESQQLLNSEKTEEHHVFDLFPLLKVNHKPAQFYETEFHTYSYNTKEEFESIRQIM